MLDFVVEKILMNWGQFGFDFDYSSAKSLQSAIWSSLTHSLFQCDARSKFSCLSSAAVLGRLDCLSGFDIMINTLSPSVHYKAQATNLSYILLSTICCQENHTHKVSSVRNNPSHLPTHPMLLWRTEWGAKSLTACIFKVCSANFSLFDLTSLPYILFHILLWNSACHYTSSVSKAALQGKQAFYKRQHQHHLLKTDQTAAQTQVSDCDVYNRQPVANVLDSFSSKLQWLSNDLHKEAPSGSPLLLPKLHSLQVKIYYYNNSNNNNNNT